MEGRDMSEKSSPEAMSRRKALSVLGLVGALGFAASVLTDSEADAQETTPAPGAPAAEGTPGMQRRQHRRASRHARRHARRTGEPAATSPAAPAQPQ
jgi:hypothetical protein